MDKKTQTKMFQNPKDQESYFIANQSNFKNVTNLDSDIVEQLNIELADDAERMIAELDPETNPYKMTLLQSFRKIEDPFGIEILG